MTLSGFANSNVSLLAFLIKEDVDLLQNNVTGCSNLYKAMPFSLAVFPGEAGENCISLPASVRPDPGQHASILPQGPLPHLLHLE